MRRLEWSRLRWRVRGAWQWPVFALAVPAEAVLLNTFPVWGNGAGGLVPGLLLAGCLNLVVVALLAPPAGRLLRRSRRDLPRAVAADYAGATLLALLFAGLLAGGVSHRAEVRRDREARAVGAFAVARFIRTQEPGYAHRLDQLDTLRVEPEMYRSCLPEPDPDRALCLFVRTDQDPPAVTRDQDRAPNSVYRSRGGFE